MRGIIAIAASTLPCQRAISAHFLLKGQTSAVRLARQSLASSLSEEINALQHAREVAGRDFVAAAQTRFGGTGR
jgi:hypothetical protein